MPDVPLQSPKTRIARAVRVFFVAAVILFLDASVLPAQACHFGGEKNAEATRRELLGAPSCRTADAYLKRCRWGSSADVEFASIVTHRCEASFLSTYPPPAMARYKQEQLLCGFYIEPESGSLALSEAAVCTAAVAADFSQHADSANKTVLRASFDCTQAASPIERATCSDQKLGNADIAMSRAYRQVLDAFKTGNRASLVRQQKAWQANVISTCGIDRAPTSAQAVHCAVRAYTQHTYDLNGCLDGPDPCTVYP